MSDPIMSPDGKFMWSGSEWIPSPPSGAVDSKQSIHMQDSVISGDVVQHTVHNDSETISAAVVAALDRIGLVKGAPPAAMTEEQHHQLEEVNEMVDSAEAEGLNLSPEALWKLAFAALLELDFHLTLKRLHGMAESAEALGDVLNQRRAIGTAGFLRLMSGEEAEIDLSDIESYIQETLELAIQHGSRSIEGDCLDLLSSLAGEQGDYRRSLRIAKNELAIRLELEEFEDIAAVYITLMDTYTELGQYDQAEAYFESSLQLVREHEMDPMYKLLLYRSKVDLLKKSRKDWFGRISKQGKAEILDYVNLMENICHEKGIDLSDWVEGIGQWALSEEQVSARMKGEKEFTRGRFAVVSVVTIGVLLTSILIWESAGLPAELLKGILLIIFFPLLLLSIAKNRKKR